MNILKKILFSFLLLSTLGGVISAMIVSEDNKPAQQEKKDPQKPKLGTIVASCQVDWETQKQNKLHDPSSLDWDRKSAELGMHKNKTPVIAIPYRAKNAYGALVIDRAICAIEPESGKVLSVIK